MKYYLSLILLLFLASCSNDEEMVSVEKPKDLKNNFTISGTITNGQNLTFYLEAQSEAGTIEVAKTKSDASGKFEMIGNIPGYGIYRLRMGETPEKVIPLSLVPNDNIKIKASYADFLTPKVTGGSWTSAMTQYMQVYQEFVIGKQELELNQKNLSDEQINTRYQNLRAKVDKFALNLMDKEPSNPFNYLMIASAMPPQTGFNDWDSKNLERLKSVEFALSQKFPESPMVENMGYQIFQLEQSYDQHRMFNAGTQLAPDISMPNPNGQTIQLSDLRGQYVLVDFWASWCGPCRKENPNVVRLYNKYKDKGFTVFSVSLDENAENWKAAIKKDGLIWPNHCSDLLRWNSTVIQDYGFSGIPYAVLLNPEGKFIGVNLRGADLEQKLKDIFEK